jgi:hypothetical protein
MSFLPIFFCGNPVSVTIVGAFAIEEVVPECLVGQFASQARSVVSDGKISRTLVCVINQLIPGNWSLFLKSNVLVLAGRIEFKLKNTLTLLDRHNIFFEGEEIEFMFTEPQIPQEKGSATSLMSGRILRASWYGQPHLSRNVCRQPQFFRLLPS